MAPEVRKAIVIAQAVLATVLAAASANILEATKYVALSTYAVFAGVAFAIRMVDIAVISLLNHVPIFRRWLFGKRYIEGFWFDVVTIPSKKTVREFGIVHIQLEDGIFVISGTLFSPEHRQIGQFETHFSKYEGYAIDYAYRRSTELANGHEKGSGLGCYEFARGGGRHPDRFEGHFQDPQLDVAVIVRGIKIQSSADVAALTNTKNDTDHLAARLAIVERYTSDFYKDFPDYRTPQLWPGLAVSQN